jgi:hypothetical protein
LIYTDDATFPCGRAVDRLAGALALTASEHLTARHGGVLWLNRPV